MLGMGSQGELSETADGTSADHAGGELEASHLA
jgi:hypothetical protein